MTKILLVGHGGREHALLHKLHRDAPGAEFFITRGNGGTSDLARPLPLSPTDAPALAAWAEANGVDLAVVGPESALDEGIADSFSRRGVPLFGPTKDAAAIETSKAYAKWLMQRAGVPTAGFATFTDADEAESFIRERGAPIVVKASGLAAGKGAVVCDTIDEAVETARSMLVHGTFGAAGQAIVVEELLSGEEISVFCLTDGRHALDLIPAQDHKRIGEGDSGPNTGGMGAYAPVSLATEPLRARIRREILEPTLDALREDDRPFTGLLYAGLMLTPAGPRVIEFNARFGDPETQALLPLLESSLLDPLLAIARGESIQGVTLRWREAAAVTTVLAAAGYPGSVRKGDVIEIPRAVSEAEDVIVYHAGTKQEDGRLLTDGGRVLAVTALGATMEQAAARSRTACEQIQFEGKQFRRDIGWRELAR